MNNVQKITSTYLYVIIHLIKKDNMPEKFVTVAKLFRNIHFIMCQYVCTYSLSHFCAAISSSPKFSWKKVSFIKSQFNYLFLFYDCKYDLDKLSNRKLNVKIGYVSSSTATCQRFCGKHAYFPGKKSHWKSWNNDTIFPQQFFLLLGVLVPHFFFQARKQRHTAMRHR